MTLPLASKRARAPEKTLLGPAGLIAAIVFGLPYRYAACRSVGRGIVDFTKFGGMIGASSTLTSRTSTERVRLSARHATIAPVCTSRLSFEVARFRAEANVPEKPFLPTAASIPVLNS